VPILSILLISTDDSSLQLTPREFVLKMAHFSSTQYNSISSEYDAVNDLPISRAIVINVERVLSPHIKGAKVLEMACGTGFFTRHLLNWGATSIAAVDISQGMIDIAQAEFSKSADASKCEFMVKDCAQPFDVGTGQFDLVFAAWLLNYSADEAVMTAIFENISRHLKPGGRLVTVAPHAEEDPLVSPMCRQIFCAKWHADCDIAHKEYIL